MLKNILLWTWCLPQILVGLVVKLVFKVKSSLLESFKTATNWATYAGRFVAE